MDNEHLRTREALGRIEAMLQNICVTLDAAKQRLEAHATDDQERFSALENWQSAMKGKIAAAIFILGAPVALAWNWVWQQVFHQRG